MRPSGADQAPRERSKDSEGLKSHRKDPKGPRRTPKHSEGLRRTQKDPEGLRRPTKSGRGPARAFEPRECLTERVREAALPTAEARRGERHGGVQQQCGREEDVYLTIQWQSVAISGNRW